MFLIITIVRLFRNTLGYIYFEHFNFIPEHTKQQTGRMPNVVRLNIFKGRF